MIQSNHSPSKKEMHWVGYLYLTFGICRVKNNTILFLETFTFRKLDATGYQNIIMSY